MSTTPTDQNTPVSGTSIAGPQSANPDAGTAFALDWGVWHDAVEEQRKAPHGILSVTALHFLTETPTRFPDLPGAWSTSAAGPVIELDPSESDVALELNGERLQGPRIQLAPIAERDGITVVHGDIHLEIAKRGGFDVLRPRDPNAPLLTGFTGTPTYLPNPRWALRGTFIPHESPVPVRVGSAADGIEHVYESPGVIEFTYRRETHRLTAFNGDASGRLFVLFTDETSGITTYHANRSVNVEAPAADGSVTIDFNRAVNLPCAYSDYATCPLPPQENRLDLLVEVGEKIPLERLRS